MKTKKPLQRIDCHVEEVVEDFSVFSVKARKHADALLASKPKLTAFLKRAGIINADGTLSDRLRSNTGNPSHLY